MMKNVRLFLTSALTMLALVTIFSAGISPAAAQNDNYTAAKKDHRHHDHYHELVKAPKKARIKRNPLESDPDAVAAGGKLFAQHCAVCHGGTASGGKKGPSLRAPEIQSAEPGAIFWVLTNGVVRRGMPVWSKLPEPQRWQLVIFIKSLGVDSANRPQPVGIRAGAPAKDLPWQRH